MRWSSWAKPSLGLKGVAGRFRVFGPRASSRISMCGMFVRDDLAIDTHLRAPRSISPKTARNIIHHRDLSPARHVRAHLKPAVAAAKVRVVSDRKKISARAHRACRSPAVGSRWR